MSFARNGNPSIQSGNKEMSSLYWRLHMTWEGSDISRAQLYIYFSQPLHKRGSDFTLFKNNWVKEQNSASDYADNPLLEAVAGALMSDRACVESVRFTNFSVDLRHSLAVTHRFVFELVAEACRTAGYPISFEPLDTMEQSFLERIRALMKAGRKPFPDTWRKR